MKVFRNFLVFIGLVGLSIVSDAAMSSAAQTPQILKVSEGTWNCTYHGPKGTSPGSTTFTRLNANWLQDTSKNSAYGNMPASSGAGLFGYDPKKRQYIGMHASSRPGNWGVSTASASPSAMSMTLAITYPVDRTHDETAYHFTAHRVTFTETWTGKGMPMSGHGELSLLHI